MAIAAPTATGAPFAKLVELGDTIVGALGSNPSESRRQQRNYETRQPAFKDDGTTPLLEEVLHLVAMPGTTAKLGDSDRGYEAIEPGTHIRYTVSGFKWGQVIDARKHLPAAPGIRAGQDASGDVYEITLAGWSAETKNAAAAQKAGFTVVDGRIVLRSQEEKDSYVLAQSRSGGNTNPAKDVTITVRRPTPTERQWENLADELYLTEPWKGTAVAPADDDGPGPLDDTPAYEDEEPF